MPSPRRRSPARSRGGSAARTLRCIAPMPARPAASAAGSGKGLAQGLSRVAQGCGRRMPRCRPRRACRGERGYRCRRPGRAAARACCRRRHRTRRARPIEPRPKRRRGVARRRVRVQAAAMPERRRPTRRVAVAVAYRAPDARPRTGGWRFRATAPVVAGAGDAHCAGRARRTAASPRRNRALPRAWQAENVPGVAMPVAGPWPWCHRPCTSRASAPRRSSLAQRRDAAPADAGAGAAGRARGCAAGGARRTPASDNAAAPWLQALAQARELAAEPRNGAAG